MRRSRAMALCGLLTALTVVLLSLGSLIPLATFVCPLLAMLCLIPPLCEYGGKAALLQYGGAACLGLLLCTDKEIALLYLFLGWYPCLRSRLERLPKLPRAAVTCGLFSLAMTAMYGMILYLFQLEAVVEEFAGYSGAMTAFLLVLGNVVFLLFDRVLGVMVLLYRQKRK